MRNLTLLQIRMTTIGVKHRREQFDTILQLIKDLQVI